MHGRTFTTMAMTLMLFGLSSIARATSAESHAPNSATQESVMNAFEVFMDLDHRLNSQYQMLLRSSTLSQGAKATLRTSQKSWLQFKESFCDVKAFSLPKPSSDQALVIYECLIKLTSQQLENLETLDQ